MLISKLALAAKRIIIDDSSGDVTAVDILTEFEAVSYPVTIEKISFAFLMRRDREDPADNDLIFRVYLGPSEFVAGPTTANFGPAVEHTSIMNVSNIIVKQPCVMRAVLVKNFAEIGSVEIIFSQIDGTSATPTFSNPHAVNN